MFTDPDEPVTRLKEAMEKQAACVVVELLCYSIRSSALWKFVRVRKLYDVIGLW